MTQPGNLARHVALWFLAIAPLAACATAPPKKTRSVEREAPAQEWQHGAVWLHATAGVSGDHKSECKAVAERLAQESDCRGAICAHSVELAAEWIDKCPKLLPDAVEAVSDLLAGLEDQAERSPSRCAKEHAKVLENGCDPDTCLEQAQSWATRCGEKEGSPLAVLILARTVARNMETDERIALDARSCATLAASLSDGARCPDEKSCKKAWRDVETHRERCLGDDPPDVAVAIRRMAIAVGAGQEGEPIAVAEEPERAEDGAAPLLLSDGSGAIVEVCRKRVQDVSAYLDAREACRGGVMSVARLTPSEGGRELRLGRLAVPEQGDLLDVYPGLAVAGEAKQLSARALAALKAELAAAVKAGGDAGVVLLVEALDRHARWIGDDEDVRKALGSRDGAVEPLFARLGEAKAKVGQAEQDPGKRRGLVLRARTRPLADVRLDGAVEIGAATGAFWLDTAALWPKSTAAHRAALAALDKAVKRGPAPGPRDLSGARKQVTEQARACVAARDQRNEAAEQLLACVFAGCADGRRTALDEQRKQAAAAEAEAVRQLDLAMGLTGSDQLASVATKEGCVPLH